jgi:ribokinase
MPDSARVAVVGSLNLDLVVRVPRLPAPGETLLADAYGQSLGGKGANQAVSAARHGVAVTMVGCVGDDPDGARLTGALEAEGVDVTGVRKRPGAPTGVAQIAVDPGGTNTIIVAQGANATLTADDVREGLARAPDIAVVLMQLEIPLDAVTAGADAPDACIVLNPAPARELPEELLRRVDVLVPNLPELAELTGGGTPDSLDEIAARARGLAVRGAVVVTLGERGALVLGSEGDAYVPAPEVKAVDTTGAGDAFCGSLAAQLARGRGLVDAVRDAVLVGALSVTRPGALEAFPAGEEIRAALGRRSDGGPAAP